MERIQEVIDLIELTGDKCVILHPDKGVYVLMKMEDYRALVTKNPLKIQQNRVISMPDTNIKIYEIPQVRYQKQEKEVNEYFPEPLA